MSDDSDDPMKGSEAMLPAPRLSRRTRKSAPDVAFDAWLDRGLRAMFDDVAKEPLPPEILALIEQDRKGS